MAVLGQGGFGAVHVVDLCCTQTGAKGERETHRKYGFEDVVVYFFEAG